MEAKSLTLKSVPVASANDVANNDNNVKSAESGENMFFYVCNICELNVSSSNALNDHLDSEHVIRKSSDCFSCGCHSCPEKFQTSELLINHLRCEHTVQKFHSCGRCGKKFAQSYSVPTHGSNSPPSKVYCSLCVFHVQNLKDKVVRDGEESPLKSITEVSSIITTGKSRIVDQSVSASNDGETEPYTCQICELSFSSSDALDVHHHSLHIVTRLSCGFCKEIFETLEILMDHLRQNHTEQNTLCSRCGQNFTSCLSAPENGSNTEAPNCCDQCVIECLNENSHQVEIEKDIEDNSSESICDTSQSMVPSDNDVCGSSNAGSDDETDPYVCEICQQGISSSDGLDDHLHSLHVKRGRGCFSCDSCRKVCQKLGALINHLRRNHTKYKISSCGQCGKKFSACHSVQTHYGRHGPPQMFCGPCLTERAEKKTDGISKENDGSADKEVHDDECIEEHSESVDQDPHQPNREFAIHTSDEENDSVTSSDDRGHRKEKKLACEVCAKEFTHKANLRKHRLNHCGKNICEFCDKKFPSMFNLKRHLLSHSGERPYLCEKCGKGFTQEEVLNTHLRSHTGEKPFTCDICRKCFARKYHMQEHRRTHTDEKADTGERPFACDACDRCYKSSAALGVHRRRHQGRKFACNLCPKVYLNRANLHIHRRAHTGDRPYACAYCGKRFSSNTGCRKHVEIHSLSKPHVCDTCGKGFTQKTHLRTHMRVHTGEKPYQCDICRRMFSHKFVMEAHRRIHTGERAFRCDTCLKTFVHKKQLRSHQRMHEKELKEPKVSDV